MAQSALAAPPLEPGVSRELARWRAQRYTTCATSSRSRSRRRRRRLEGKLELRVAVRGKPVDLVLDWRPPAGARLTAVERERRRDRAGRAIVHEHLVIPARHVRTGENVVQLAFESPIATAGTAITLYRDREDGSEYVYSLFVPSDASTVFPCFDQPDLKARFTLALEVPRAWEAVSNAPAVQTVARRDDEARRASARPSRSAPISSRSPPGRSRSSTTARTASRRSRRRACWCGSRASSARRPRATRCSCCTGRRSTGSRGYFGFPFPFPKHDLVLVPEFPYGGMEHAGATFLREESVLFPFEPAAADRLRRAQLLLHETSHQWFGDLVTMRWFDDLWLKEGFANFMAAKATAALAPGVPRVERVPPAQGRGLPHRRDAGHDADLATAAEPLGGEVGLRQHRVQQGAGGAAAGRVLPGRGRLPARGAGFRALARVRRSGLERPRPRARGRLGTKARRLGERLGEAPRNAGRAHGVAHRPATGASRGSRSRRRPRSAATASGRCAPSCWWPATAPPRTLPVALEGRTATVRELAGAPAPRYVFANHGDYAYGRFVLDDASRAAVLADVGTVADPFLRALLLDTLWDEVRDARLAPLAYVDLALAQAPREPDELTVASLVARTQTALRWYLSDAQRAAAAPRVEAALVAGMTGAARQGPANHLLPRVHRRGDDGGGARDAEGAARGNARGARRDLELARPVPDRRAAARARRPGSRGAPCRAVAGRPLGQRPALRVCGRRGAARSGREAARLRRVARGRGAARELDRREPRAVQHRRARALDRAVSRTALAQLPKLKRERKIFFVNNWLAAFLGGPDEPGGRWRRRSGSCAKRSSTRIFAARCWSTSTGSSGR